MKRSGLLFCTFLASRVVNAQPDVLSLVKQSIANHDHDWRESAHWRYKQEDTTYPREEKHVETSEVIPLLGTPYERLIARNGVPLTPEEQKREDLKHEKAKERRQKETSGERAARIKKREQQWAFLKDVPNAYDFALQGEEVVNGRPAWVVRMTPRAAFTPTTSRGSILKHLEGKLWIDKQDVRWAKAEAHVIDTIEIGWVLARVGPGAEIRLEMTRVADHLWMPKSIEIKGSVKVMMVRRKSLDEEIVYSDYARADQHPAVQVTERE